MSKYVYDEKGIELLNEVAEKMKEANLEHILDMSSVEHFIFPNTWEEWRKTIDVLEMITDTQKEEILEWCDGYIQLAPKMIEETVVEKTVETVVEKTVETVVEKTVEKSDKLMTYGKIGLALALTAGCIYVGKKWLDKRKNKKLEINDEE